MDKDKQILISVLKVYLYVTYVRISGNFVQHKSYTFYQFRNKQAYHLWHLLFEFLYIIKYEQIESLVKYD